MSHPIITLLSTRYIHAAFKSGPLRTMMWLCFGGITIGSFALMMTVIITQGFEIEIGKQLKGINSDLIITAPGNQLAYNDLKQHLLKKMGARIAGISGSHTRQILLQHNGMQGVAAARGVVAADEGSTTTLEKSLQPQQPLTTLLAQKDHIIVGKKLAEQYGIRVGDTITLLLPITHSNGITVTKQSAHVTGTFKVGLEEYDANVIYTSFETLKSWFSDIHGMQHVAVNLQTPTLFTTALAWWHNLKYGSLLPWSAGHFKKMLVTYIRTTLSGLQVYSWKELYPAIVDSLAMETYVSGLVLALIMLVASMNMISLLFMLMQYKQKDIAILRAMGTSPQDVRSLYH